MPHTPRRCALSQVPSIRLTVDGDYLGFNLVPETAHKALVANGLLRCSFSAYEAALQRAYGQFQFRADKLPAVPEAPFVGVHLRRGDKTPLLLGTEPADRAMVCQTTCAKADTYTACARVRLHLNG